MPLQRGFDLREPALKRPDPIAGALRFTDVGEIEHSRVTAILTGGDAVARSRHTRHNRVQDRHRTPFAVGVDQYVESSNEVIKGDFAIKRKRRPGKEREVVDRLSWPGDVPVDQARYFDPPRLALALNPRAFTT